MSLQTDTRRPAWVERVACFVDGQPSIRLIFIFRAIGCAWARTDRGGCTNCGFQSMTTQGATIANEDLIEQFDSVFSDPSVLDAVGEVDLYNSGSFLSEQEIPTPVREHVLRRLSVTHVQRVLIESRPEYVTAAALQQARQTLGSIALQVGIGLESSDDRVREVLVHKGFDKEQFERAVSALAQAGASLLCYVLIKPLGLSEQAAVEDAIETSRYVWRVAAERGVSARVALQPTFVAPKTVLEREFLQGRYQPPSLWSVVKVVSAVHSLGEILIGMSDEGLEPKRVPSGCSRCTAPLRAALVEYNRTHELRVFDAVRCDCQASVLDGAGHDDGAIRTEQ